MAIKLDLLPIPDENIIILNDDYLYKKIVKSTNTLVTWLTSSDPYYSNKKKDKKDIESIQIPSELEVIKKGFDNFLKGTKKLPVVSITNGLFKDCNLKSVIFPKTLEVIGDFAFKCCPLENLVIPEGVTNIGESAFEDCENLLSIKLPESLREIGDNAFSGCTSLEKVYLPNSVEQIGDNAFKDVKLVEYDGQAEGRPWGAVDSISREIIKQREEAKAKAEAEEKKRIEEKARIDFENSKPKPVTLNDDYIKCLLGYNDKSEITSLTIKSDYLYNQKKYKIIEISPSYFQDSSLKSLVIESDSVLLIGKNAFKKSSLEEISIKEGLRSIKTGAFQDCHSLKSVKIPRSIGKIENFLFENCTVLETIEIPEGIKEIGIRAFKNCSSLKEIIIPSSVTTIRSGAFMGCTSLKKVVISSGVTNIGESVFEDCDSLEEIKIPDSVEQIGDYAFLGIKKVYYNGNTEGRTWGADIVKTYSE